MCALLELPQIAKADGPVNSDGQATNQGLHEEIMLVCMSILQLYVYYTLM